MAAWSGMPEMAAEDGIRLKHTVGFRKGHHNKKQERASISLHCSMSPHSLKTKPKNMVRTVHQKKKGKKFVNLLSMFAYIEQQKAALLNI